MVYFNDFKCNLSDVWTTFGLSEQESLVLNTANSGKKKSEQQGKDFRRGWSFGGES